MHERLFYLRAGATISVQARSYCTAGFTATPRARAAVKTQWGFLKSSLARRTTSAFPSLRYDSVSAGFVSKPIAPIRMSGCVAFSSAANGTLHNEKYISQDTGNAGKNTCLVAVFQRDLLLDPVATAACVDEIDPETLQFTNEEFALFDTPLFPFSIIALLGAFSPVCRTYPYEKWFVRPSFTYSRDNAQREPHPV